MAKPPSPTQGSAQCSFRLTAVAKRWADEIHQDYLVVASILLRFARGDYGNKDASVGPDPNLRLLLSGAQNYVSISSPPHQADAAGAGGHLKPGPDDLPPVGVVSAYREPDIEGLLEDFDPPLDGETLVAFCGAQQIPLPPFLTASETAAPSAGTFASTTPTQLAIRKATTAKRHEAWRKEYVKLKRKHPDKSDRWIAARIAKSPVADGCAAGTIRKSMKPRRK